MTKEEYLALASRHWESLQELEAETNFYDYEKNFDSLLVDFGKTLLNEELQGSGKDRRQKKSQDAIRRGSSE